MKCSVCGSDFEGKFCTNCGTPAGNVNSSESHPSRTVGGKTITCKKCGSTNVSTQVINEVHMKDKHHGCLWWLFVGCWWVPIKWLFLTLPALLFAIFGHKKQKAVNKQKTVHICQNCGNQW